MVTARAHLDSQGENVKKVMISIFEFLWYIISISMLTLWELQETLYFAYSLIQMLLLCRRRQRVLPLSSLGWKNWWALQTLLSWSRRLYKSSGNELLLLYYDYTCYMQKIKYEILYLSNRILKRFIEIVVLLNIKITQYPILSYNKLHRRQLRLHQLQQPLPHQWQLLQPQLK